MKQQQEIIFCDICGKDQPYRNPPHREYKICALCGNDLCSKCAREVSFNIDGGTNYVYACDLDTLKHNKIDLLNLLINMVEEMKEHIIHHKDDDSSNDSKENLEVGGEKYGKERRNPTI